MAAYDDAAPIEPGISPVYEHRFETRGAMLVCMRCRFILNGYPGETAENAAVIDAINRTRADQLHRCRISSDRDRVEPASADETARRERIDAIAREAAARRNARIVAMNAEYADYRADAIFILDAGLRAPPTAHPLGEAVRYSNSDPNCVGDLYDE